MNLKRHTTRPASTACTKATLTAGSTGYVGSERGSNSDTSRATLGAREASRPGPVRNTPLDKEQSSIQEGSSTSGDSELESSISDDSSISGDSGFGGSDTSFEVEENPAEEETSNAIYKRHMFLKKHGYPLWIPQPNETLPCSYQRRGVSIGDVGIFTSDGGFDFLFNICLPAGHPSNPDELPEGFSCLDLKPADVCKFPAHSSHSHMASPLVQKQGATFECSGSDGAILTMPQGAYHEDLRNIRKFKDYAFVHAKSWYQYANGPCGREISKGELHLVTGCDKTTSWGIAAYSHIQSGFFEDNVTRLSFNVSNEGRGRLYPTYIWDYEGTAEAKAGPEDDELMDSPKVLGSTPLQNQCTFVRSFTLALGDEDSEHLPSEARASAGLSRMNPIGLVSGATSSSPGRFGSMGGRSRVGISRLTDSVTPAQTLAAHPATYVIDVLLQKCPKAKVVVVHDNDWCSVIRDSDNDWTSTSQDLRHRIQEAFDIIEEENGAVYLQEKVGSSQQLSASSRVSVNLKDEDPLEDRKPSFSQLFDSFEISPSDIKSDSPPRSLKTLFSNWNDDTKRNTHRDSDENDDDDLGDQGNPMLDASLEFIFRQMKSNTPFKESSSPLQVFEVLNNDCDDDGHSRPCFDPSKAGPVFFEFVSSQIQKMKNKSSKDAFALPADDRDDDNESNTDHDSSQGPFRLDTDDLDNKNRITLAAFIQIMSQLVKNNNISFREAPPTWPIKKLADKCNDNTEPNLFDDSGEADLESIRGFVCRDIKPDLCAHLDDEDYPRGFVCRDIKPDLRAHLDDEDYPMSNATFPEPTSRTHKQKNANRNDSSFVEASSIPGTPSFRESFAQLAPESFTLIRKKTLPTPTFYQNNRSDIVLDDNSPGSSEPGVYPGQLIYFRGLLTSESTATGWSGKFVFKEFIDRLESGRDCVKSDRLSRSEYSPSERDLLPLFAKPGGDHLANKDLPLHHSAPADPTHPRAVASRAAQGNSGKEDKTSGVYLLNM